MTDSDLPPVISILLGENLPADPSPSVVKKFFRRLLPELRRQARWTEDHFEYSDANPAPSGMFTVTASGMLNPLSVRGLCNGRSCRLRAADHLARTVGLYADSVTIPDPLSGRCAADRRLTNAQLMMIADDLLVLRRLEPLIRAGIVGFRNPWIGFCKTHYDEFEEREKMAAAALLPDLKGELTFRVRGDFLEINTGRLYEPPLQSFIAIPAAVRGRLRSAHSVAAFGHEAFGKELQKLLREVLVDMHSASRSQSAMLSGSRLDLLALKSIDCAFPGLGGLEHWEEARSVELPWIRNLTPKEVIEVRQEARLALPRLREAMLRMLRPGSPAMPDDAIASLRSDAAEVEAELNAMRPSRGSRFRGVAGTLGIAVSVYGFATGILPGIAALGSLGSLLGLLHTSARKDEQDLCRLMSRPGYALIKAREKLGQHKHVRSR